MISNFKDLASNPIFCLPTNMHLNKINQVMNKLKCLTSGE